MDNTGRFKVPSINIEDTNKRRLRNNTPSVTSSVNASNNLRVSSSMNLNIQHKPLHFGGMTSVNPNTTRGKKVYIKKGFSTINWYELNNESSKIQGNQLISGLGKLIQNEEFIKLNETENLINLQRFVNNYNKIELYKIRPMFKINQKILSEHQEVDDCWCVIKGRVYSISRYMDYHPGGKQILINTCLGKDVSNLFDKYHRWVNVDKLLEKCCVGVYTSSY
ncbi:hypothetical protein TBLA_0I01530 [Henningerozyma blattae CBS 6284]|uniref:Cytochrome b5 heme-binding domain-containing protein n=1 Tax=Henningerozyma blattae (strain ATCC 34711 / CBS 6284 / DSM 70876 / NBRC 10599 / NRRL Y-10934 / UCD 77-7) TaxID=1071380 RepID=I2H8W0_HENB6|nr:hypothetical protein TBLA_0I01530 [Tetrapisispora blattae CBS 6284]CCH62812.1 hypothetical protein TBLA_0I01530 [Tetrapisispora blattae CBS 6284]